MPSVARRELVLLAAFCWLGTALSCALVSTATAQDELASAESYVAKYEQSLAKYAHMKALCRVTDFDWPAGGAPKPLGETEWGVFRDGDRLRVFSKKLKDGTAAQIDFESISVQGKSGVSIYPDGTVFSKLKTEPSDFSRSLAMAPCAPGYGIIFLEWIPATLRRGELSVEAATLEGTAVVMLRGVGKEFEIKLWLDPDLGIAARKIWFHEPVIKHLRQCEFKRFREQAGIWVAEEATVTYWTEAKPVRSPAGDADGKPARGIPPVNDANGNPILAPATRYLRKLVLAELDLAPQFTDADFRFERTIANGRSVNMLDGRDRQYIWQDGEIVPAPMQGRARR